MTSATAPSLEACSSFDQTTPFLGLATDMSVSSHQLKGDIPAIRTLGLEVDMMLMVVR